MGEGAQKRFAPKGYNKALNPSEKSQEQCHLLVSLGCEVGGVVAHIKASNKLWRCVTQDVTQHLWMKNWLSHLVLRNIKNCRIARVGREGVKYVLRDVKTFPNLRGPA